MGGFALSGTRRKGREALPGSCDGSFSQDLNALWTTNPLENPGAGVLVQAQLWYRDPQSTSNQSTSLSDAIDLGYHFTRW